MAYRVKTFLRADLLKVVQVKKRRGRPMKIYRAVADMFFIPFAAMPYADVQETLDVQISRRAAPIVRGLARVIGESKLRGQYLYRAADGEVWISGSPPSGHELLSSPETQMALDSVGELWLTTEQAKAFRKELARLRKDYEGKQQTSGECKRFGYCLLFAALEE